MNLTYDSQMFRETFESEFTWLNGFMRNVRRFSDKPAAIDPQSGRTWSYKELNADANRFALLVCCFVGRLFAVFAHDNT